MAGQEARTWSDAERTVLDALLEQIVPATADGRVPSAASLSVAEFLAAKVATEPALEALFQKGLGRAADLMRDAQEAASMVEPHALAEQLERLDPDFFNALLRYTYMGYYSDARIRPLFGLSEKPTQPEGYAVPPDDPAELAALIEPVRRRGQCYRKC